MFFILAASKQVCRKRLIPRYVNSRTRKHPACYSVITALKIDFSALKWKITFWCSVGSVDTYILPIAKPGTEFQYKTNFLCVPHPWNPWSALMSLVADHAAGIYPLLIFLAEYSQKLIFTRGYPPVANLSKAGAAKRPLASHWMRVEWVGTIRIIWWTKNQHRNFANLCLLIKPTKIYGIRNNHHAF